MRNRVSAAQLRKAFINSLNVAIHSAVPAIFRINLVKNLLYVQVHSTLRFILIPFLGLSFSNSSFYVSSHITSR